MSTINIKQSIRGALLGDTGYVLLATTPQQPEIAFSAEEYGQNIFSPEYASLFVLKARGSQTESIIHIQGQHVGPGLGRMYDTRAYYSLSADDIEKAECRIGQIVYSLPRIRNFVKEMISKLPETMPIKDIEGTDSLVVERLQQLILRAIAENKHLQINLDEECDWRLNGVLGNDVAKTLFAAIDALPKALRPCASLAISVDDKYSMDFLSEFLIVLYHGNNIFDSQSCIDVKWSDLKNDAINISESDFGVAEIELALKDVLDEESEEGNAETNIYLSRKSSMEIVAGIGERFRNRTFVYRLNQDWKKLLSTPEIAVKLKEKATNANFVLEDIYGIFNNNFQKEIKEKFVDVFVQVSGNRTVEKKLELLKTIIDDTTIENELRESLQSALADNILAGNCGIGAWCEFARLMMGSKYEQNIIDRTAARNEAFFTQVFSTSGVSAPIRKGFLKSRLYNSKDKRLCSEPFLAWLEATKKKELRETYITDINAYGELYAGISYKEITALNVDLCKKIGLLRTKADKQRFTIQFPTECARAFNKDFLEMDIKKSCVYKLYKSTKTKFPDIDDSKVTVENLQVAWDNAKAIGHNLRERRIPELYNLCDGRYDLYKIFKITKVKPDTSILAKYTPTKWNEYWLYFKMGGARRVLFNIDKEKLKKAYLGILKKCKPIRAFLFISAIGGLGFLMGRTSISNQGGAGSAPAGAPVVIDSNLVTRDSVKIYYHIPAANDSVGIDSCGTGCKSFVVTDVAFLMFLANDTICIDSLQADTASYDYNKDNDLILSKNLKDFFVQKCRTK